MTTSSSLIRKSLTALLVAGAVTVAAAPSAQAFPIFHPHHHHWGHHWGPGWGWGLAAGAVGAAIAADAYAGGYCHLERRFDEYGNYLGRVRVCN